MPPSGHDQLTSTVYPTDQGLYLYNGDCEGCRS